MVQINHHFHISSVFILKCAVLLICLNSCSSQNSREPLPISQTPLQRLLLAHYRQWEGVPYRWGGENREGVDCSGFVQLTFAKLFGIQLPRSTAQQSHVGEPVLASSLHTGDIVFFQTGHNQRHNGIYLQNRLFIHVSSTRGVMISSLDNRYWATRYWRAIRVL